VPFNELIKPFLYLTLIGSTVCVHVIEWLVNMVEEGRICRTYTGNCLNYWLQIWSKMEEVSQNLVEF